MPGPEPLPGPVLFSVRFLELTMNCHMNTNNSQLGVA